MKILIDNISDFISKDLNVTERGILLTILLLKDSDPKMTLAKFKTSVKIAEYKQEMINLHEKGFILWSEVNKAKKYLEKERLTPDVLELFVYINKLLRTKYKTNNSSIVSRLTARLEDYSKSDIKKVFANRYMKWKDDDFMKQYLNPDTILRPSKFAKYYEETMLTKVGSSYVNAQELNLKFNDSIDYKMSLKLVDDDVYDIRIYNMQGFKRIGNGIAAKKYGRDIKQSLHNMKQSLENGGSNNILVVYKGN